MPRTIIGTHRAIWLAALGYFGCYLPYSALTKALTRGFLPGQHTAVTGMALLPMSTLASVVVLVSYLSAMGWWKYAHHRDIGPLRLPMPTPGTALSGLSTAVILATTTLAYTFEGISIVFAMLLMRGGVLILAPIVDALTGRRSRWFSWVALLLALSALLVAFSEDGGTAITALAAVDISLYLAAYMVRLRVMSGMAKTADPDATRRYFVEEQLMATPATLVALAAAALVLPGSFGDELRVGFTAIPDTELLLPILMVGVLSQGVGIFGTLIFLDPRENTFSVPVNRSASILAGVLASLGIALYAGTSGPSAYQLAGAGLVLVAITVLGLGSWLSRGKPA
jgi:hypothetical protein